MTRARTGDGLTQHELLFEPDEATEAVEILSTRWMRPLVLPPPPPLRPAALLLFVRPRNVLVLDGRGLGGGNVRLLLP